jgi:hypothetical protein
MARTLQQARGRAARVAGRVTSTPAEDAKGHSGKTKANINEGAKEDEVVRASQGNRAVGQT